MLHRLWQRNLIIDDRPKAEHALATIGYFRLLIYMRKFQSPIGGFSPRGRFSSILELYEFDRSLRTLSMEATERVELALRQSLGNEMALFYSDPHWYMHESHYETYYGHHGVIAQVIKETKRVSNVGAQHYFSNYGEPRLPPAWQICQKLSFGALSRMYSGLKIDRRKKIAASWMQREILLVSWFRSATTLRNECAHHGRLWKAVMDVDKPMSHSAFAGDFHNPSSFYARACAMKLLLDPLGYGSWWKQELMSLLGDTTVVNPRSDFGFPLGWESRPLWA